MGHDGCGAIEPGTPTRQLAGEAHIPGDADRIDPDAPDSQFVAGTIACPVHASVSCRRGFRCQKVNRFG